MAWACATAIAADMARAAVLHRNDDSCSFGKGAIAPALIKLIRHHWNSFGAWNICLVNMTEMSNTCVLHKVETNIQNICGAQGWNTCHIYLQPYRAIPHHIMDVGYVDIMIFENLRIWLFACFKLWSSYICLMWYVRCSSLIFGDAVLNAWYSDSSYLDNDNDLLYRLIVYTRTFNTCTCDPWIWLFGYIIFG